VSRAHETPFEEYAERATAKLREENGWEWNAGELQGEDVKKCLIRYRIELT